MNVCELCRSETNQKSDIEKSRRNKSSIAENTTTSCSRERPAQTSVCCFGSFRSLSVYVVATRAVSMRSLGGCYISYTFIWVFYLSGHGII